jgi:predicted metal-dependent hydrolase
MAMGEGKFYFGRFKPWPKGQRLYDGYNKEYFNHRLPVVHVGFYEMKNCYGVTFRVDGAKFVSHICLNPLFKHYEQQLCQTLLHEMIHVLHNNKYGHGKKFKKEIRRLLLLGAFDDTL